jgi:hypothetical protein
MMTDVEMTDAEVADQIDRADRFIEQLRDAIAATVVDPDSPCADYKRRGLRRIAATLDAVPFVTVCNLANLNTAMRGGLMDLIEVNRGASDVCRWWPDIGLSGRSGVPHRVPADDRHGPSAAAQLTPTATT